MNIHGQNSNQKSLTLRSHLRSNKPDISKNLKMQGKNVSTIINVIKLENSFFLWTL